MRSSLCPPDRSQAWFVVLPECTAARDSRHIVVYDKNGSIRVIGENGAVEHEHTVSDLHDTITPVASTISTPAVLTAAVAPDASRIALTTNQGTVAVINTSTGQHIDINSKENPTPIVVRWIGSAANGLVLVVSESGVAATYSPETGEQVARFPGLVYDALPLSDDQPIAASGRDWKLHVWDARTGTEVAESSTLNTLKVQVRSTLRAVRRRPLLRHTSLDCRAELASRLERSHSEVPER